MLSRDNIIKTIKYFTIFFILFLSQKIIYDKYNIDKNNIILISMIASISFALLDILSPSFIIEVNNDKN